MPVSLDVLDSNAPISDLQNAINQTERLGFRLLSMATGFVSGQRANLVTFAQDGGHNPPTVSLAVIDSSLSKDQQEAALNTSGKSVVCYGSLYVQGQPQNIAAYR
jgi:hypothetical protein